MLPTLKSRTCFFFKNHHVTYPQLFYSSFVHVARLNTPRKTLDFWFKRSWKILSFDHSVSHVASFGQHSWIGMIIKLLWALSCHPPLNKKNGSLLLLVSVCVCSQKFTLLLPIIRPFVHKSMDLQCRPSRFFTSREQPSFYGGELGHWDLGGHSITKANQSRVTVTYNYSLAFKMN